VTERAFFSRQERFSEVGSTNDVVRGWLTAGTPEVCLAVADAQTSGRGRDGRTWTAPPNASLLLSVGFRPTWLEPDQVWRLAAVVSLAMADAAEEAAGLPDGLIALKWPNDLVAELTDPPVEPTAPAARTADAAERPSPIRKLAGVLGETDGLGSADPRAVIGIGINADWAPKDFPPELTGRMTSLREASNGRPIDRGALLDAFLVRLEPRVLALHDGHFPVKDWIERQLTIGRWVDLELPNGAVETVRCVGVDVHSGGLVIEDSSTPGGERIVLSAEIRHLRVTAPAGWSPSSAASSGDPARPIVAGRV
jgi:BirA family biotin operon repressor/biotin-[acetyl-CoA-carboxylase] ligase